MSLKSVFCAGAVVLGMSLFSVGAAQAACVSKSAQATSGTEALAKWFAMETMVQGVSWGLWPGWVATGNVAGYNVTKEKYKCNADGAGYTCIGWATFCPK